MIALRNEMINSGNTDQKKKICPVLPPLVSTKTVNEGGETVTKSEIIHGIASPGKTDDTEDMLG